MLFHTRIVTLLLLWLLSSWSLAEAPSANVAIKAPIDFEWGVKIPLHDGVKLAATLYRPQDQKDALPCIFTLTPYIAQSYHDRGTYFATHGYVFAAIDARGRGNSEGEFTPLLQEVGDSPQIVEWLARQPYCNGKITMWGGSYAGYDQWTAAMALPPHLATIVPVASPRPGVDFPALNNIPYAYDVWWLNLTSGRTGQEAIFGDVAFWSGQFDKMFLQHRPFKELDAIVGNPSSSFQTWVAHPASDAYWDSYSPSPEQFAKINLPILTITGQYDDDQPGALSFYREHLAHASEQARQRHYLIIGPWDHAGTRTPADYGGLKFGPASLLDMNALHKDWYDWTLKGAARPEFLKNKVAYYVLGAGAEEWRYADSLDAVTARSRPLYLGSADGNANDVFASGGLDSTAPKHAGKPDRYVYDPLDTRFAAWDGPWAMANALVDQSGLLDASGKILVYHSPAYDHDFDLAGFFKLRAYIALDQPDTDLAASVYEIKPDGSSVLLTSDMLRARYRKSPREAALAKPGVIERYDFNGFKFVARRIAKGSRLRLAIGPMNSKYMQKNYNSGGVVADESGKDARSVRVTVYHDAAHPSALYLPIAAPGVSAGNHP